MHLRSLSKSQDIPEISPTRTKQQMVEIEPPFISHSKAPSKALNEACKEVLFFCEQPSQAMSGTPQIKIVLWPKAN